MTASVWTKWACTLALAAVALAGAALGAAATAQNPAPGGKKHALLIGCTVYPELPAKNQLRGPANDVALTTTLLRERFGYAADEIVTLVHDNEESMRPTHDNIVRAFAALIDSVGAGDTVFILIGGHGSQVKNDNPDDPNDMELDGMDEVFLPEDVTTLKSDKPAVQAIRDDQIHEWLDAIRARGALVFFVADTCCSNTVTRGQQDDEPTGERSVDPELFNGPLPPKAPLETAQEGDLDDGTAAVDPSADPSQTGGPVGMLVALYAVDADKSEKEHAMPPDSRTDGPIYGRLTYALNWVLTRSRTPLNYREVAQRIQWQYQSWKWSEFSSVLGSRDAYDRRVLGDEVWTHRSAVTLSRNNIGLLSLNVGLLHGATVGSIYAVYPPVGSEGDDVVAGYVTVEEATPTISRAAVCEYNGNAAVAAMALPEHGRCELVYSAFGSIRLKVGVRPLDGPHGRPGQVAAVEALVREMQDRPAALVELAGAGEEPAAWLLVADNGLYLRRPFEPEPSAAATPLADEAAEFPPDAFGPFEPDANRDSKLSKALDAMAKATNVRRLAAASGDMLVGVEFDPAVTLKVVVDRWDAASRTYKPVDDLRPLDAFNGDKLRVRVFNESGPPVDVTILYIESAFRIRSYFPTAKEDNDGGFNNRITAGGAPAPAEFEINDSTTGLEDVIIIATLPEKGASPQNFAFLEQAGLQRGRKPANPLEQLLTMAAFGTGGTRGSASPDIARYAVRRVSWTVRPQSEAKK